MPREIPGYRDAIAHLNELAPHKELFRISEAAELLGVDRRTVVKLFDFTGNYISKVQIARGLANIGRPAHE